MTTTRSSLRAQAIVQGLNRLGFEDVSDKPANVLEQTWSGRLELQRGEIVAELDRLEAVTLTVSPAGRSPYWVTVGPGAEASLVGRVIVAVAAEVDLHPVPSTAVTPPPDGPCALPAGLDLHGPCPTCGHVVLAHRADDRVCSVCSAIVALAAAAGGER